MNLALQRLQPFQGSQSLLGIADSQLMFHIREDVQAGLAIVLPEGGFWGVCREFFPGAVDGFHRSHHFQSFAFCVRFFICSILEKFLNLAVLFFQPDDYMGRFGRRAWFRTLKGKGKSEEAS